MLLKTRPVAEQPGHPLGGSVRNAESWTPHDKHWVLAGPPLRDTLKWELQWVITLIAHWPPSLGGLALLASALPSQGFSSCFLPSWLPLSKPPSEWRRGHCQKRSPLSPPRPAQPRSHRAHFWPPSPPPTLPQWREPSGSGSEPTETETRPQITTHFPLILPDLFLAGRGGSWTAPWLWPVKAQPYLKTFCSLVFNFSS